MAEKYNFISKLSAACSDDNLRPMFQCVHFIGGYAYATDAHTLVKQSLNLSSVLQSEELEGVAIHKDSFDAIRKFDFATANSEGIECKNTDGNIAFFPYFDLKGEKQPDFDSFFTKNTKPESVQFIGMNLDIVKKCLSAMYSGSGQFRFKFFGISNHIIVDCIDVEDQIGLVLPIMLQTNMFND